MRDLKLDSLKIVSRIEELPDQIKTEALKPIAQNLVSNVQRVAACGYYSQMLTYWMFEMGLCVADSFHAATERYYTDGTENINSDQRKQYVRLAISKLNERKAQMPPEDHMFPVLLQRRAISQMTTVDTAIGGKFTLAAESIMTGMITSTWTAFEVLAQDLWKTAVNQKPDTLFKAKAKKDTSKPFAPVVTMKIELNDLIATNYNLRENISGIAEKQFDIRFDRYERISEAYKSALNNTFPSLDSATDRSLFGLSQTRNVIVHNAGNAAKEFLEKMVDITNCIPQFSGLTAMMKVPLDGELVSSLVNDAINSCVRLVLDVDDWITHEGRLP